MVGGSLAGGSIPGGCRISLFAAGIKVKKVSFHSIPSNTPILSCPTPHPTSFHSHSHPVPSHPLSRPISPHPVPFHPTVYSILFRPQHPIPSHTILPHSSVPSIPPHPTPSLHPLPSSRRCRAPTPLRPGEAAAAPGGARISPGSARLLRRPRSAPLGSGPRPGVAAAGPSRAPLPHYKSAVRPAKQVPAGPLRSSSLRGSGRRRREEGRGGPGPAVSPPRLPRTPMRPA